MTLASRVWRSGDAKRSGYDGCWLRSRTTRMPSHCDDSQGFEYVEVVSVMSVRPWMGNDADACTTAG
jgi:hypothetical protein